MLCENPARRTGLTTFFDGLVRASLEQAPDVRWLLFAGLRQPWALQDPRIEVVRTFAANDRLLPRLWADHFHVGPRARAMGADALLTIGFVPVRAPLPVVMQVIAPPSGTMDLRSVYRRQALTSGLRRAALVIANSEWAGVALRDAMGERSDRLMVSYEGLAVDQFQPAAARGEADEVRKQLGVSGAYFLWVGNFYHYKRADRLLAAYACLSPEVRAKVSLVLVGGEWQKNKATAVAQAARMGLGESVRFPGWIDDRWIPALYRQARAHVMPSTMETFGKTVTEAMACGCPCLLNDLPVLREVAGGAAHFVDFGDEAVAAAALERLAMDDRRVAELRAAGLRRVADFSYAKLARERIGAIKTVLRKGANAA